MASTHHVVATVDEIPPGGRKIVEVAGRSIGIFNLEGDFVAVRNRCPHQGGPLCLGTLVGAVDSPAPGVYRHSGRAEMIRCPWHAWEFNLRDGRSWFDPEHTRVRRYEVTVGTGEPPAEAPWPGLVPGPYRLETYDLAQDARYLLISVEDGAPAAGEAGS
jgi:3-phenylpropionate/trans-cinnamate dioxygenase ferredoxin subunit